MRLTYRSAKENIFKRAPNFQARDLCLIDSSCVLDKEWKINSTSQKLVFSLDRYM